MWYCAAANKSPYTKLTGADTAPGAQELPGAGANQLSLTTVTRDQEEEPRNPEGEKSRRPENERRNWEAEESGADGERTHPRMKQEDEEEADGGTNHAAAWEA
ncbi:hypothetical protein NDU88_005087 [Pleurodeles waltl]|uniref:Uncharacterized protein n=1 Tax=Pleurodeles waltl TaxID=8319 RepID=A0AAV7NQH0_PLEWA|nr:hypothetical protein NDU88_005087 [Pleurodeles waltl]